MSQTGIVRIQRESYKGVDMWAAKWECGQFSSEVKAEDKDYVLAWARARSAPSEVRIEDPDTGDWSPV